MIHFRVYVLNKRFVARSKLSIDRTLTYHYYSRKQRETFLIEITSRYMQHRKVQQAYTSVSQSQFAERLMPQHQSDTCGHHFQSIILDYDQ